jgi:hypothetical protein
MSSGSTPRPLHLALGLCLLGLALQSAHPARAQSSGYGGSGHKDACIADYAKYCSMADKFAFKQCLLDHQPDYSPACKAQRAAERDARMRQSYNLPPAYH